MRSQNLVEELALEVEGDVLPPWPSAFAFVEALVENPDWLIDVRTIIDVGCGSGILGIAAARLGAVAHCHFVDINPVAVSLALRNAGRNGIDASGTVSDVWEEVNIGQVDLIISNPPFQPAGDGGRSLVDPGLRMHRALFAGAAQRLLPGGRLLLGTAPAVTGGREPEAIAANSGWTIADASTVSIAAPSQRHPDRVHDYTMLLLQYSTKRNHP